MVLRWLALMKRIKQICFPLCRAAGITSLNLFMNRWEINVYMDCPESICLFWTSREPVMWPWCNLIASWRRPYWTSVNSHSPMTLVSCQWNAVDWACILCDRHIQNDLASRSASLRQSPCPFYSSRAGFFGKTSHHPGVSTPLQPRFGSLQLLAFPKAKIAVEREEICKCDGHTVHKLSQWHLTADWLTNPTGEWLFTDAQ